MLQNELNLTALAHAALLTVVPLNCVRTDLEAFGLIDRDFLEFGERSGRNQVK